MPAKLPESFTEADLIRLSHSLGLKTLHAHNALRVALENIVLLDGKQQDYGPKNISEFGAYGCVVRMSDKFERVKHLYKNRKRRVVNESILDSFRDFSNYGVIATLCETKKWPEEDAPVPPII